MEQNELTFNDLPQVVAQLRDEVMGMRRLLIKQQEENRKHQVRENRHKPMTVEEAAEYTRIPLGRVFKIDTKICSKKCLFSELLFYWFLTLYKAK